MTMSTKSNLGQTNNGSQDTPLVGNSASLQQGPLEQQEPLKQDLYRQEAQEQRISSQLMDGFGRTVDYVRISVTDRCDFRCIYCMAEDMTFMPRKDILSLEEIELLSAAFVSLGVKKIRITGGEPLIRKGIDTLIGQLSQLKGLEQLCLTTNGSHLKTLSAPLKSAGLHRINISLDTLDSVRFTQLTRHGKLTDVLAGIDAALEQGFNNIKINAVLMKNYNLHEASHLAEFALNKNIDISFIEEMPLGEILSHARDAEFISSEQVRQTLSDKFTLHPCSDSTGGPSRYWKVDGHSGRIGFISPHSDNFCADCNRVRVTATGRLLLCLGNEHSVDLKAILREKEFTQTSRSQQISRLKTAITKAMHIKPEKHEFNLSQPTQILRFMNTTGG